MAALLSMQADECRGGECEPSGDQDAATGGRSDRKKPVTEEGARRNIAGKQHRADNPGDGGGERERPPHQALVGERAAAENRRCMEKKQISRAGEAGMRRRVRACGGEDDARGPHQSGENEQDGESHAPFTPHLFNLVRLTRA